MTDSINFTEVEKIHPAFAGLLVDWSIGSREITATIVNLIIKDNISVIGDKIILNNLNTEYDFEKEFLKLIFDNKKELSFEELSSRAYNLHHSKILTLISKALVTEGYIVANVSDVVNKNAKDQMNNYITKYTPKVYFQDNNSFIKSKNNFDYSNLDIINLNNFSISFSLIKLLHRISLIVIIFFFVSFFIPILSLINFLLFPLVAISFFVLIITYYLLKLKKLFTINLESVLTPKGKSARNSALDLYNYIKKYPHLEDRLANELVSYSIAFGIGKNWINRLGIGNVQINSFLEKYNDSTDIALNYFDLNKFLVDITKK